VLVGGRHLDPGDELALTEGELGFSFAAELAHIRFGHARVTGEQVWDGVLSKGKQGLDVFPGLLPMLRGLEAAGRVGKVASQIEPASVRRAVESATAINDAIQRAVTLAFGPEQTEATGIAASNERLIAAHRFVQLSADRVGLAFAGDLRTALRAVLLTRRDYAALVPELERTPLEPLLEARIARGDPAFADLSVRIAALISFYLSDEYENLRARPLREAPAEA
jgi:hypothetical protein